MGIINRLRAQNILAAGAQGGLDLKDPELVKMFGGAKTAAGQRVDSGNAMRVTAVYAAVKRKTDGVSMVPLQVRRRLKPRGSQPATDLGLYRLLHDQPNEWQTSMEFREMLHGHVELRGNGYAYKLPDRSGYIQQLIPMHPDNTRPFWVNRKARKYAYRYRTSEGQTEIYLPHEIFHVRGLTLDDPLLGLNPIEFHRETIGHSLAAQEYSSRFYANDATPPVWLEHPQHFKDSDKRDEFRRNFIEQVTGDNRHAPAVIEDGIKVHSLAINQRDSQYIEGRKFSVTDIARIFQVVPHMIGDLDRASFSNINQMSLEHVIYTLTPQYARWEQAGARDLFLTREEKDTLFLKFVVEGLLRGDIETRYKVYRMGITDGHMTRNEARELEDRNPEDGLDEFLFPGNMVTEDGDQPSAREDRMTNAAAQRIVTKELKAITKAFEKIQDVSERKAWLKAFYQEHRDFVSDVLCIEQAGAEDYCGRSVDRWCEVIDTYGDIGGRFEQIQMHQVHITAALNA